MDEKIINKIKLDLRFSTRMTILVSTLLITLFVTNGISLYNLNKIGSYIVEIAEEDIPLTNYLSDITVKQLEQALELERAVRITLEYNENHPSFITAIDNFEKYSKDVNSLFKSAEELAQKGKQYAHNDIAAKKFEEINNQVLKLDDKHKIFDQLSFNLIESIQANGFTQSVEDNYKVIEKEEKELINGLETLLFDIEQFTAKTALEAEQIEKDSVIIIASLFTIGIIIGLIASITTFVSVNRQMGKDPNCIMSFAKEIADGDLRPHEYEITESKFTGVFDAMINMRKGLTTVLESIKASAIEVETGSREIAQGNLNLSNRTEQQSANLQETASNMDKMTSTVRQNADNAKQANQLARAARDQAEKGGIVVGNAVTAMNEINESSKKIADIISVIDEIAFQTNLLALNAAVEAARAGEQGRGFAVVATEVRNLAGRSATAAKEIKELIQDSVNKIVGGAELVNESGESLNEIVTSVKKVSDIIAEIAASSEEQSNGIQHVGNAVSEMDDLTQQNAALVEQVAASSETIGKLAQNLRESVAFFKTDEESSDVPEELVANTDNAHESAGNDSYQYH